MPRSEARGRNGGVRRSARPRASQPNAERASCRWTSGLRGDPDGRREPPTEEARTRDLHHTVGSRSDRPAAGSKTDVEAPRRSASRTRPGPSDSVTLPRLATRSSRRRGRARRTWRRDGQATHDPARCANDDDDAESHPHRDTPSRRGRVVRSTSASWSPGSTRAREPRRDGERPGRAGRGARGEPDGRSATTPRTRSAARDDPRLSAQVERESARPTSTTSGLEPGFVTRTLPARRRRARRAPASPSGESAAASCPHPPKRARARRRPARGVAAPHRPIAVNVTVAV